VFHKIEISVKSGKDRVSTPSLVIDRVRLKENLQKKYISIQRGVKLRKFDDFDGFETQGYLWFP
jgi:hypothetical protein